MSSRSLVLRLRDEADASPQPERIEVISLTPQPERIRVASLIWLQYSQPSLSLRDFYFRFTSHRSG